MAFAIGQYFDNTANPDPETMPHFSKDSVRRLMRGDWLSDDIVNNSAAFANIPAPIVRQSVTSLSSQSVADSLRTYGPSERDFGTTTSERRSFAELKHEVQGLRRGLFDAKSPFNHVLIPLHGVSHWSLLVVNRIEENAYLYDSCAPAHLPLAQRVIAMMQRRGLFAHCEVIPVDLPIQRDSSTCGYAVLAAIAQYSPMANFRETFPRPTELDKGLEFRRSVAVHMLATQQAFQERISVSARARRVFPSCGNGVPGCRCGAARSLRTKAKRRRKGK